MRKNYAVSKITNDEKYWNKLEFWKLSEPKINSQLNKKMNFHVVVAKNNFYFISLESRYSTFSVGVWKLNQQLKLCLFISSNLNCKLFSITRIFCFSLQCTVAGVLGTKISQSCLPTNLLPALFELCVTSCDFDVDWRWVDGKWKQFEVLCVDTNGKRTTTKSQIAQKKNFWGIVLFSEEDGSGWEKYAI